MGFFSSTLGTLLLYFQSSDNDSLYSSPTLAHREPIATLAFIWGSYKRQALTTLF